MLRDWCIADYGPFADLNADPRVMEHFPSVLSRNESDKLAADIQRRIEENGWGFWAVEEKETGRFIGFVGLNQPQLQLPFTPCVEVGWRLAKEYWGKGYATEAGRKAIEYAFEFLNLPEVVAFTATKNVRSQAVMARLGMTNAHENFDHPAVPIESGLREHVLFRITSEQWQRAHI